jgi:hypothetical protein
MNIHQPQGMAEAKAGTQRLIDGLNDGGVWMVPRSGTIIQFDKASKKALVTHQLMPDISIEMILEAMGWEITYKKE